MWFRKGQYFLQKILVVLACQLFLDGHDSPLLALYVYGEIFQPLGQSEKILTSKILFPLLVVLKVGEEKALFLTDNVVS